MEVLDVIRSKYCWLVGLISVLLGYWFVVRPFMTPYSPLPVVILSYTFLLLFALSLSCMVRNIRKSLTMIKGSSLVSILAYLLGFASIQTCFASGMCVANLTVPMIATFFPALLRDYLEEFSLFFLTLSILAIALSLFYMGCFSRNDTGFVKPTVNTHSN